MHKVFVHIYYSLKRFCKRLIIPILILVFGMVYLISKMDFEEDISALIPMDERISSLSQTFSNSKFADQIVFTASLKDTSKVDTEALIQTIDSLALHLQEDTVLVKSIRNRVNESAYGGLYEYFYKQLPYYLFDNDYAYLDSILDFESLNNLMDKNYKSIIAPTGFGTARYILKDPLSLVPRVLKRLKTFELDKNFIVYNGHIFTQNKKSILCFLEPENSSKNTKINRLLIDSIDSYLRNKVPDKIKVEYYGGTAVAVANANRVQNDIYVTISIALILLLLLFVFVFKSFRVLFILFAPVALGVGIALSILTFYFSSVSVIALGVGAILIGISIDFSLHYFSHVRYGIKPAEILKDITDPVIMSSLTTASAFFCLTVVKSSALNQLGLFAGLSVIISSIMVLIILPLLLKRNYKVKSKSNSVYDKLAAVEPHRNKIWLLCVIFISILFWFIGKNVGFDADISNLNYLTKELSAAEKNLKSISSEASSAIYVVASGTDLNDALIKLEKHESEFNKLVEKQIIKSYSSPTTLLISNKKQDELRDRWNNYWEKHDREKIQSLISIAGTNNHFKEDAFNSFFEAIDKDYKQISDTDYELLIELFLSNFMNEDRESVSLTTICKVDQDKKKQFFDSVSQNDDLLILDKQFFTNQFFNVLRDDFSKLINYSMLLVFIIVLLFWGRFELALITFIPIVLSWQWTVGMMSVFDIKFNIFNIIICTFIFGLGIDYSIFLLQGMINNYKYGKKSIKPYKVSILLSVSTTLIGVGVLIFAQHPALKSIAMVTIMGLVSVILITFTILPFLFSWLAYSKNKKRAFPIVLIDIFVSILTFIVFLIGVLFLSVLVLIFRITPFFTNSKKKIIHYLLYLTSNLVVRVNVLFNIKFLNKEKFDLTEPSVIVSNHQSHLDIVLLLMHNPKIIVLTNEWVWKNPFYGFIIRYIDFYPIYTGIDKGYEKIKSKVEKGYSVLVFPEGTRTKNGKIHRFHQGAFSLADYLGLDILPVIIHGAYDCMPKTEFFLRSGHITLKCFDKVKVDPADIDAGITYRPQAKRMTAFYREEYEKFKMQCETVDYYARRLINQYVYKGPVLEWYLRIKIRIEDYYRFYNDIVPRNGKIIDVGCGYGFLCNMLSFTSPQRDIIGWDYDNDKIDTAREVAANNPNIIFSTKDVVVDSFEQADVYMFNDVLHYFSKEKQKLVLSKAYDMLNDGGCFIIRDADSELQKRTKFTKLTEFFSIYVLKFNKMKYEVEYLSTSKIEKFAQEKGLKFEMKDNSKYTSNVTYILRKEKEIKHV